PEAAANRRPAQRQDDIHNDLKQDQYQERQKKWHKDQSQRQRLILLDHNSPKDDEDRGDKRQFRREIGESNQGRLQPGARPRWLRPLLLDGRQRIVQARLELLAPIQFHRVTDRRGQQVGGEVMAISFDEQLVRERLVPRVETALAGVADALMRQS